MDGFLFCLRYHRKAVKLLEFNILSFAFFYSEFFFTFARFCPQTFILLYDFSTYFCEFTSKNVCICPYYATKQ